MRHGWLLDKKSWQFERKQARTISWTKVPLRKNYSGRVPKSPGVYMICVSGSPFADELPFSSLYEVAYVGQASALRQRFEDHIRGYGDIVKVKEIFGRVDFWFTMASADHISELESRLIKLLGPVANRKHGSTISGSIGRPEPVVGHRTEEN